MLIVHVHSTPLCNTFQTDQVHFHEWWQPMSGLLVTWSWLVHYNTISHTVLWWPRWNIERLHLTKDTPYLTWNLTLIFPSMWCLFLSCKEIFSSLVITMPADVQWSLNVKHVFSGDQAAIWLVQSVCPSVCPSVCLSVRPSHLFHHVPIIVSSWNFQELLPMTKVTSMQKVKVRGQRSRSQRSRPNLTVSGL